MSARGKVLRRLRDRVGVEQLESRQLLSQVVAAALPAGVVHTTAVLSQARDYLAATTVGTKAIFAGGSTGLSSVSDEVDIYDNATGQWSTAKLSQAREKLVATTVGTKALFAGGDTAVNAHSDVVDIYDNATGQWSTATLSRPRVDLAATSVGTKAFFAGGADYRDVVDIYDAATGQWSTARLSQAREKLVATTVGNKAMFAGGVGATMSDVADIYDNATGQWSTAKMSQARCFLTATSVGSKAIFAGGIWNTFFDFSSVVDIYDNATGRWSTAALSQAREGLVSTSVGTFALFGGGWANTASDAMDMYDSTTGQWFTSTLSQPREDAAATAVGNKAIFAGGFNTDTVDIWSFPTDLVVKGLSATPASVVAGGTLTANRSYQVASFAVPNNFYIQYHLSTDRVWGNADDIAFAQTDVIWSDADKTVGTHSRSFNLTVPLTVKPGNYYLVAKVDSTRLVAETNESNNLIAGNLIKVIPPVNDAFANRAVISGASTSASGVNINATAEAGEPGHAGYIAGKSVWWTWTAPDSGRATMDTIGSSFNTLLGVYVGSEVGKLSYVASNNDISATSTASGVAFRAVRGQSYHIAVDGYGGAVGTIQLNAKLTAGVLDDKQALLSPSTAWNDVSGRYQGGQRSSAAGKGANTATWTFANLLAGTYRISATWRALGGAASNTPFGIYDGSSLLGTVMVNQKVNPDGSVYDGVIWQAMCVFRIASGSLTIKLTNDANGYVLADGVRIEKIA